MKKILFALMTIVMLGSACSKKGEPTPTPVIPAELKTYLSKEITIYGTHTWTYDVQNRVTNMAFVSKNEMLAKSYNLKINNLNAEGAIVEAVFDYVSASVADEKQTNVYNAQGKLIRQTDSDFATGAIKNYRTVEYLAGNQIKETHYNANNAVTSSTLYTKSADGEKIIEYKNYAYDGTLLSTIINSNFDTKKNYDFLHIKGFGLGISSVNNYQTETYTDAITGVATINSYSYEYNTDAYVTKMYFKNDLIYTYEYIKK